MRPIRRKGEIVTFLATSKEGVNIGRWNKTVDVSSESNAATSTPAESAGIHRCNSIIIKIRTRVSEAEDVNPENIDDIWAGRVKSFVRSRGRGLDGIIDSAAACQQCGGFPLPNGCPGNINAEQFFELSAEINPIDTS